MARPKGSVDPEVTHKLDLMAELIVGGGLTIPDAARQIEQMWANDLHVPLALNPSPWIRFELLEAITRGQLAFTSVQNRSIDQARERAEAQTPPRIPGTNPRRTRMAMNRAGRKAIDIATGAKSCALKPQVEALVKAYRDRGDAAEQRWVHACETFDTSRCAGTWIFG
jgi:hypothetical protein